MKKDKMKKRQKEKTKKKDKKKKRQKRKKSKRKKTELDNQYKLIVFNYVKPCFFIFQNLVM